MDWNDVERRVGLPLPEDYKDYIAHYGTGSFDEFVHVCLPTTDNENLDLACRRRTDIDALRELQSEFEEEIPYRIADPAELLPVAVTTNGDIVYWHVTEDRSPVSSRPRSPDESGSPCFPTTSPIPSPRLPLMTSSVPYPKHRSWASPSEAPIGSGVATQIALMQDLADGDISAPDFARSWLSARRRSLDAGERTRERFDRILTDVFYLLDDYVIDPSLRDEDDMTDEDLSTKIRESLDELDSLNY